MAIAFSCPEDVGAVVVAVNRPRVMPGPRRQAMLAARMRTRNRTSAQGVRIRPPRRAAHSLPRRAARIAASVVRTADDGSVVTAVTALDASAANVAAAKAPAAQSRPAPSSRLEQGLPFPFRERLVAGVDMSIPRLAIHRPVTMFMISGVITLLGAISLTRLPVDLMPEFEQPTLTVRTTYTGVGPLEMEELITRPMEQAVSAVPGLTRVNSQSSEGNSQVQLNFEWGSDLSEAANEVRTRVDRVRGRLPEDADPPFIFKFDSNSQPIMQIGVEGDFDPVTLREVAENELAPRFERVDGVAAVQVNGGLRRAIHA